MTSSHTTAGAPVAGVVLAHADAPQVRRLLRAVSGMPVFLHCDRRAPADVFLAMTENAGDHVTVLRRRAMRWGEWSLVAAELDGLRAALSGTRAAHIVVMSGACYPLMSVDELAAELATTTGRSRLWMEDIPYAPWSVDWADDGGRWRFETRFLTVRGRRLYWRGKMIRAGNRKIPPELRLKASSQWKVYARSHAQALLGALDARPDLMRFWRATIVPDESCVASILSSPALVGHRDGELIPHLPWYMDFPPEELHPRLLTPAHLDDLRRARDGLSADGVRPRALFARKVSSSSGEVLEAIDEMRGR